MNSYKEPLDIDSIINKIINAYKDSVSVLINKDINPPQQNQQRSRILINKIHDQLIPSNTNQFVVFSKYKSNSILPLQEFLYDIHVCEYGRFGSATNQEIRFIKKSIIQLECEFDDNIRNSALDFSKLVCGNAKLKIMILPLNISARSKQTVRYYCEKFNDLASGITEPLFLIFLPHPSYWQEASVKSAYEVRKFNGENCNWEDETNKFQ